MVKKIRDKTVDCACNTYRQSVGCSDDCECLCHTPIFIRNLVWIVENKMDDYFGRNEHIVRIPKVPNLSSKYADIVWVEVDE